MSPVQRAYYGINAPAPENPQVVHRQDAATTRGRKVRARNRRARKFNIFRIALGSFAVILLIGSVYTLLTHPIFNVKDVAVEGNRSIATETILKRAGTMRGKNIVLLNTTQIQLSLLKEPTFESVIVSRTPPNGIKIAVHEREPWATVKTITIKGVSYFTIDRNFVPFRGASIPNKELPLIRLDTQSQSNPAVITLGKALSVVSLNEAAICVDWAKTQTDFPLESVVIASDGKLCLNRVGGALAQLGSPVDLDRKLVALQLILQQPDVRAREWTYINLFAYDAPAVRFKQETTPVALLAANNTNHIHISDSGDAPSPARGTAGGTELP